MDTQGDWTSTAGRIWLWPVAILVSFPIGGSIADPIVEGVDSVGAALAGTSSRARSSERQSGSREPQPLGERRTRCRRSAHLPAARVQRVLLPARATLRLPGHSA